MAKRKMYSFAEEKHSRRGILSTVLGVFSFVVFAALAWLSYYLGGQAGPYAGSIGFTGLAFTVCGAVLGLMSFGEDNVRHVFSRVGSVLNGIMLALWVFVIILGI